MKRFVVIAILTAVIAGILTYFMPCNFEKFVSKFDGNATVSIYCRQTSLEGIDMGCGYKITCDVSTFSDTLAKCGNVDGISVSFNGTYQEALHLQEIFALRLSSIYEQDGLFVVCGKSNKIRNGILDDGQLVNLQIAYRNGLICVGSPLILGDY